MIWLNRANTDQTEGVLIRTKITLLLLGAWLRREKLSSAIRGILGTGAQKSITVMGMRTKECTQHIRLVNMLNGARISTARGQHPEEQPAPPHQILLRR